MGARAILSELIEVLRDQSQAVVRGDHQAVLDGASRHERLLDDLAQAEMDGPPEELRTLHRQLTGERDKLHSLLLSEMGRVDYLLRLSLGAKVEGTTGYPQAGARRNAVSGRLNRQV